LQISRCGFHCCVENGYDRVDLCEQWNESQGEYYRDALLSQQMLPAIKRVADVVIQWRKRLRACVRADGQHFEDLL